MQKANQELHLWPVNPDPRQLVADQSASVIRLPHAPALLGDESPLNASPSWTRHSAASPLGVLVEPFFNQRKQLRLLAWFPAASAPQVNGEPAPRLVVLAPGDFFQWAPRHCCRIVLFNKPQIGAPPVPVLGKPCPICRVPFSPTSTCVTCVCGVVLHCEPDEKAGLQCAQMRRECPVCRRPIVLKEGYADPPSDED